MVALVVVVVVDVDVMVVVVSCSYLIGSDAVVDCKVGYNVNDEVGCGRPLISAHTAARVQNEQEVYIFGSRAS